MNGIADNSVLYHLVSARRTSDCNNNVKKYDIILRNIQLFSLSIIASWFPIVLWQLVHQYQLSLTNIMCEGLGKLASITPWIRFVILKVHEFREY